MGAVLHTLNIRLFPEQLTYITHHAEDHVLLVDGALVPMLAPLLPTMTTVRHVVVTGGADASALAVPGVEVHAYDELLAAADATFAWPTVDENDAAALCYTSGTTGNPKGVAYSHRSIWLHSMQVCASRGVRPGQADSALTVVPQFHAMAWGVPYAAFMSGASLLMPDRFLQAEPLARMIAEQRPTFAAAVPTIWSDLLRYLDQHGGGDLSSLREVVVGGSACPPSLMRGFLDRYGMRIIHAWGMTETSPLGSVAARPRGWTRRASGSTGTRRGGCPRRSRAGWSVRRATCWRADGEAVGELEVRGHWVSGGLPRRRRSATSSTTAGCAPVTSAP